MMHRVCFIGAGKLATQLSVAMRRVGYEIVQVYSRTEESARTLAEKLQCAYTTDAEMLSTEADLYVCALKDSVITTVLNQAKKSLKNKMLVHTAGSMPMDILASYTENFGVLYPMQTFSKTKTVDFSKVPFLIEGSNSQVVDYLKIIADKFGAKSYNVSSEDRKKIHLAAVFVSNFTNHAYTLGAKIVQSAGVPFEVLLPLIDETAEKVHCMTPKDAQSGPAVRNDQNVMAMHKAMLKDDENLLKIYEIMSESIYETSKKR